MDLEAKLTIDLEKYGRDGTIVVSAPDFARKVRAKNMMGNAKISRTSNGVTVDGIGAGDSMIISMIGYIEEAPFQLTLKGFMDFMASLDAVRKGMADELFTELEEVIAVIVEGGASPSNPSPRQENASSE
jgi:hypothetical protein